MQTKIVQPSFPGKQLKRRKNTLLQRFLRCIQNHVHSTGSAIQLFTSATMALELEAALLNIEVQRCPDFHQVNNNICPPFNTVPRWDHVRIRILPSRAGRSAQGRCWRANPRLKT
jgi:hypothetical protein